MPPVPAAIVDALRDCCDRPAAVGVSGGRDSVALVRMLAALGSRPLVVHVRHGLRDDHAEAAFVGELARELDLPCVERAVTLDDPSRAVEEQARRLRYDALFAAAAEHLPGGGILLTAHTRDDLVETVLHNLIRGTGLAGVAGFGGREQNGIVLTRPLLAVSRAELTAWLAEHGFDWRDDPTNQTAAFTRNRIRHELVPVVESICPQAAAAIARFAATADQVREHLDAEAAAAIAAATRDRQPDRVCLDRRLLASLSDAVRVAVFRQLWAGQHWPQRRMGYDHYTTLAQLAGPDAAPRTRLDLPAVRVTATPTEIVCQRVRG